MGELTKEELLEELDQFICEQGLYSVFIEFMETKGYTKEEVEKVMENRY